jgi:rod shape-determining protein MreC
MKWISNLVSGYVRTINLVTICLFSLALIGGGPDIRSVVNAAVVTVFYYPFSKFKNTVIDLTRVADDNRRLQQALGEAGLKLSRLAEIERENERLRGILNFEPPAGYTLLQARVLSVSGTTTPVSAIINRGRNDSVTVDMAVINEQGLIGRVVSVFDEGAIIQLLTDPSHRVAARVARSREMGIVKYRAGDGMQLDNFPIQGSIKEDDLIVSSGLGGIFPAGLAVGTVTSVERSEEEPFCDIRLEPAATFNSVEELFILQELGL